MGAIAIGIDTGLPNSVVFMRAARHIDQRAVPQLDALERVAVVGDGDAILAAPIDELEHRSWQAAFGGGTQVIDVQATIERGHGLLLR